MNIIFFNLEKRKKRDILAELLKNDSSEGLISKKEMCALDTLLQNSLADRTDLKQNQQPKLPCKSAAEKVPRKSPVKETCYLSGKVYKKLDKAESAIRRLVPQELQGIISKSYIVNQALDIVLQEFMSEGENSRIMHNIMQNT